MASEERPPDDAPLQVRVRWALEEIRRDMERDTAAREGEPLTGRNVAVWLGEISAAISGLAGIMLAQMGPEPDGLVHGKTITDDRLCAAAEGQFATTFWSIVDCEDCKARIAVLRDGETRSEQEAPGVLYTIGEDVSDPSGNS